MELTGGISKLFRAEYPASLQDFFFMGKERKVLFSVHVELRVREKYQKKSRNRIKVMRTF